MVKVKLLAFLLCRDVTRDADGTVTLHDIFDRIVLPQIPISETSDKTFSVYCKVNALRRCVVSWCLIDPLGHPVRAVCGADPIQQAGLMQSRWWVTHSTFRTPGTYKLQFSQRDDLIPSDARLPGPVDPDFSPKVMAATYVLATAPLILEEGKAS